MDRHRPLVARTLAAVAVGALSLGLLSTPAQATLTTTSYGTVDSTKATAPSSRSNPFTTKDTSPIRATVTWTSPALLALALRDPSGVQLAATKPGTSPLTLTFDSPAVVGKFAIGVRAASGGVAAYTLTIEHSLSAQPPAASPLTYSSSFGYRGHAGIYPYGMAYDPTDGTMLAADVWNYNVKRYTTDGVFTGKQTGKPVARGVEGGMGAPFGIAVDSTGNLWVADQSNSRIVKYGHDLAWKKTVNTNFLGCAGGSIPTHLAVDLSPTSPTFDQVFDADPRCRTVYVFGNDGTFMSNIKFSFPGVGTPIPRGIAFDSDPLSATYRHLFVTEFQTKKIFEYDTTGLTGTNPDTQVVLAPVKTMVVPPKGDVASNDLSDVRGLTLAANPETHVGRLYAVGAQNSRVVSFDTAGNYLATWGADASIGRDFDTIRFIANDPAGNVYISDLYGYRVWKLDPTGKVLPWAAGVQGPPKGGMNQNNGIGIDPTNGKLYVVDTFENRVQVFNTTTDGTPTGPTSRCVSVADCPAFVGDFGHRGPLALDSADLDYPHSGTFADGHWWMDAPNAVLQMTPTGTMESRWGLHGKGVAQFSNGPQGIRVVPDATTPGSGLVWTSDVGNCRIMATAYAGGRLPADNSAAPVKSFGTCGKDVDQMTGPRQLDVRGNLVYVADTGNGRVDVWDTTTGHFAGVTLPRSFGGKNLNQPRGLVMDPSGTWLYIADSLNKRVVRVHPDGTSPMVVSTGADTPQLAFGGPEYLEFGPDGRLFVSDNNQTVYAFTVAS